MVYQTYCNGGYVGQHLFQSFKKKMKKTIVESLDELSNVTTPLDEDTMRIFESTKELVEEEISKVSGNEKFIFDFIKKMENLTSAGEDFFVANWLPYDLYDDLGKNCQEIFESLDFIQHEEMISSLGILKNIISGLKQYTEALGLKKKKKKKKSTLR
eukprot:Trichotokara_eunicae@DN11078_c0_g1_i1.p1